MLVDLFESAVAQWMGLPAQRCITGEFCGKGVAIEHDGSVYSCDHYVYPEYRLGNIHERPISEMVFSRRQMDFGFAKRDTLPQYCRECKYLFACWGECPEEPIHQDARRAGRAELSVRRVEAVLRARRSAPQTNCRTIEAKVTRKEMKWIAVKRRLRCDEAESGALRVESRCLCTRIKNGKGSNHVTTKHTKGY